MDDINSSPTCDLDNDICNNMPQDSLLPAPIPAEGNDDATMALAMDIAMALRRGEHPKDIIGQTPPPPQPIDTSTDSITADESAADTLAMLLGSGESQCQSRPSIPLVNLSHSSPLGVNISEKIRNKIWNNEYIDIGFLLGQNSTIDKLNLSVTLDSQSLSLVPNMRPQTIKSIDDWTSAFIV